MARQFREFHAARGIEAAGAVEQGKERVLHDVLRIGAVLRGGKVLMPSGALELEIKDRVVLFARADGVREVEHPRLALGDGLLAHRQQHRCAFALRHSPEDGRTKRCVAEPSKLFCA